MKDKHLWVGYLALANKKVLVASDDRVDTGNRKTIFLYNQERNELVEYSREIIQTKLKDAPAADFNTEEISNAYQKALRKAKPNLYRVVFAPSSGGSALPTEKKTAAVASGGDRDDIEVDISDDIEVSDDDSDDADDWGSDEE